MRTRRRPESPAASRVWVPRTVWRRTWWPRPQVSQRRAPEDGRRPALQSRAPIVRESLAQKVANSARGPRRRRPRTPTRLSVRFSTPTSERAREQTGRGGAGSARNAASCARRFRRQSTPGEHKALFFPGTRQSSRTQRLLPTFGSRARPLSPRVLRARIVVAAAVSDRKMEKV